MVNKKLLVYGSVLFILLFAIPKESVCSRVRKKILKNIKLWLGVNGKGNPNISSSEYIKLVKDSGEIIKGVHDTMTLMQSKKKLNMIDPASLLTLLTSKVPELSEFNIEEADLECMRKCYEDSGLGFPTLMFVNRLIPLVDTYVAGDVLAK
jgi:hypothetical protein